MRVIASPFDMSAKAETCSITNRLCAGTNRSWLQVDVVSPFHPHTNRLDTICLVASSERTGTGALPMFTDQSPLCTAFTVGVLLMLTLPEMGCDVGRLLTLTVFPTTLPLPSLNTTFMSCWPFWASARPVL